MLYNEDWRFMNDTASRWCRIVVENKMSTCCTNAEFAKGMADSCSGDCVADCIHTKMTALCNEHFGTACILTRRPFTANEVKMTVRETFCVPKDCDNPQDLESNLVVKWFDAQYAYERTTLWMFDYSDTDPLECPSMAYLIIIIVVTTIIVVIISIPLGIFLFKAPKERGRVMRSAEDDYDEDTPVESMPALPDANATAGSGFSK